MKDMRAYLKPWNANQFDRLMPRGVFSTEDTSIITGVASNAAVFEYSANSPTAALESTGGLLFPYTPIITSAGGTANYESYEMTHSNYAQPVYKNSKINDISLSAVFTANTTYEAEYMLGAIRFCANATKMNFGFEDKKAGLPPPILKFSYMGKFGYDDVPVVMSSYSYELGNEVDYVTIYHGKEPTQVPTMITLSIELKPYYNPILLQSKFKLDDYMNGIMATKGYL